jgi:outer membrane protein assembly factor BamB
MARLLSLAVLLGAMSAGTASGAGITNGGSDLRDGWYSNQPRLAPDAVSAATFGQMWKADVDGQVYAQPLVHDGNVIVATERNNVYSLDAETGAARWSRNFGPSFPAALIGPFGCFDLQPDLGVTSTPVIDPATNTIYLTHKTYATGSTTEAAYWLDALDATTGAIRPGFPVRFEGTAQNAPGVTFHPTTELQRPGLLLMDGVIYAGFGGHCDLPPYQGWVFGVNATTGAVKARWTAVANGDDGAGIWQSGSGLMSDGAGRIFVSTGNGGSPTRPQAAPGNGQYGESIVRLDVQGDGTLKAKDFFAPSDAANLDQYDADFASAGLTALRDDTFGTTKYPHMAVAVGKAGYVYLLNRDDLGGFQQAPGNGERVVQRTGPFGGVWSRPGVWPGDGGWIAIPAASSWWDGLPGAAAWSSGPLNLYRYRVRDGEPSLDAPVSSDDAFGFGSGAPVITSEGTASGSAVLWIVWAADSTGANAQLRAYDPVPVNGHLRLRRSWPIGQSSKFSMPGVGNGRLYVGTRDGHVVAFGAPVKAEV